MKKKHDVLGTVIWLAILAVGIASTIFATITVLSRS